MSILSDFEDRVAAAVEGVFAGAFRSPVQPAELAKALAKAMDDERMVGVGKVYAPVAYKIALSPEDTEHLLGFAPVLSGELATYLAEHANEQHYHLPSKPVVSFTEHPDLRLGRFRVSAEHGATEEAEVPASEPAVMGEQLPSAEGTAQLPGIDTLSVGGHDVALHGERVVIGRLKDCDICLADANVSRKHAELRRREGEWDLVDLESTNGTAVNGEPMLKARLEDGDVIEIGLTRLTYHRGKG